jgi:hypothetical protein
VANHDGLSDVVRRQLFDLRIDADGTDRPRPRPSTRFRRWCGAHKQAIAVIGGIAAVIVCVIGLVVVMASAMSGVSASGMAGGSQASVSLGNITVHVVPPAYRRFSPSEVVLFIHLDLRNTLPTQAELLAGDIALADPRGALFPPVWHEAFGNSVDGFSQPDHTLLALAPGAEVQVDLQFLVLSDGPFVLRYERRPEHAWSEPLSVGLLASTMMPLDSPTVD